MNIIWFSDKTRHLDTWFVWSLENWNRSPLLFPTFYSDVNTINRFLHSFFKDQKTLSQMRRVQSAFMRRWTYNRWNLPQAKKCTVFPQVSPIKLNKTTKPVRTSMFLYVCGTLKQGNVHDAQPITAHFYGKHFNIQCNFEQSAGSGTSYDFVFVCPNVPNLSQQWLQSSARRK